MADVNMTPKQRVEKMLKAYQHNKRIMVESAAEIERFSPITEDETIDLLNFNRPEGERIQNTNISQKVADIAGSYKKVMNSLNREVLRTLMAEYQAALTEVTFVEYAIRMLPDRERAIMHLIVLENESWTEVCAKCHLSNSMVGNYRKRAVDLICQKYEDLFARLNIDCCASTG